MITFKQFLAEDIFAKNGELFAALNPSTDRKPSTSKSISTNLRPLGHQTGLTRGQDVYYAFSYKPSTEEGGSTDLLKSFKGSGPFTLPQARRDKFIADTAAHMGNQFQKMRMKPDVIVTPQSSSALLKDFATQLADKLGVQAVKIGAFKKASNIKLPEDKAEAMKLIEKKFIDHDYLDEKFSGDEATRAKAVKEICQAIYRSITKNGHIVSKELPKLYGKFVKGTMEQAEELGLTGKTVMVVDDILSSGSTMSDLFRATKELGAEKVYGATIFARTSSAKEEK